MELPFPLGIQFFRWKGLRREDLNNKFYLPVETENIYQKHPVKCMNGKKPKFMTFVESHFFLYKQLQKVQVCKFNGISFILTCHYLGLREDA